jgi:type I restriction enzyme S subunit
VSDRIVKAARIPLPPLDEQRRIADILDRADSLRVKRRDAVAQLDTLIPSILLDMFGDPRLNTRNWPVQTLMEVCRSVSDIDHKMPLAVDSGIPLISAKDLMDDGTISFANAKQIAYEDYERLARKGRPEKGDVVYSRIGTVGKARLVTTEVNFLASYSCCTIKPRRELVEPTFLCHLLDSPAILAQALGGVRAIGVPDLGLKVIKEFKLIIPPLELQREFTGRCHAISATRARWMTSLSGLDALFASVQHRGFAGEL